MYLNCLFMTPSYNKIIIETHTFQERTENEYNGPHSEIMH